MADYRRMVSYMYQYEKGIKKKNVGYARIETRNGECRFTLRMQLPGLIDSIFPTYLIRRPGKEMELIYLGDSILKNQMVDTKLATSEMNISNAGYNLSEMGGMLMFLNDQEFFATEWDDKPVVLSEVLQALKPKTGDQVEVFEAEEGSELVQVEENNARMENCEILQEEPVDRVDSYGVLQEEPVDRVNGYDVIRKESVSLVNSHEKFQEKRTDMVNSHEMFQEKMTDMVNSHEILQEKMTDMMESAQLYQEEPVNMVDNDGMFQDEVAVTMEKAKLIQEEARLMERSDVSSLPLYKLPRGWKTIELLKNQGGKQPMSFEQSVAWSPQTNKAVSPLLKAAANTVETEQVKVEQAKVKKAKIEKAKIEKAKEEQARAEQAKTEQTKTEQTKTNYINKSQEDNIDYIKGTRESKGGDAKGDNTWEEEARATKIFESYPRIYPFEGNEVTLCVKIEPKDIGFLPVDAWVLSNNSFLMHGYYCYNHLIFAKIRDRYETKYILGVPGIYYSREQFMAKMFGFENFKSIRRRELMQGDFGYWYIPIAL